MNQNKKTSTTIAAIVLAVALAFGVPVAANAQYGSGHNPITFCHKPGTQSHAAARERTVLAETGTGSGISLLAFAALVISLGALVFVTGSRR